MVDTTAPGITVPDSITIEASGAEGNLADIGLGSGSDTVEIISVTSDSPDTFPLGETVITWTATRLVWQLCNSNPDSYSG